MIHDSNRYILPIDETLTGTSTPSQNGFGNIYSHSQTVSFYLNSSVWLDTLDALSWNWNPPNFTLDLVSYRSATVNIRQLGNNKGLCSSFCLFAFCLTGYQSAQFIRITPLRKWQSLIPEQLEIEKYEQITVCSYLSKIIYIPLSISVC